jgi:hypothetical protein
MDLLLNDCSSDLGGARKAYVEETTFCQHSFVRKAKRNLPGLYPTSVRLSQHCDVNNNPSISSSRLPLLCRRQETTPAGSKSHSFSLLARRSGTNELSPGRFPTLVRSGHCGGVNNNPSIPSSNLVASTATRFVSLCCCCGRRSRLLDLVWSHGGARSTPPRRRGPQSLQTRRS